VHKELTGLITFSAKSAEWLNKFDERQVVFLTHRLDVSAAKHRHQRREHVQYKLFSRLLTLRHFTAGTQKQNCGCEFLIFCHERWSTLQAFNINTLTSTPLIIHQHHPPF